MKSCALPLINLFLAGLFPCMLFGQSPIKGLPFVRNFSTLEYKAGIQNWSLGQDKRGILYVANNQGLLEFDGINWQVFAVNNGSKIRSVGVDASGRIYVGCQGEFGYFFPDARGQFRYTSLADSLPAAYRDLDETWNLFLDEGKVYFCTFSNIFIYDKGRLEIIEPEQAIELSFFVNRELLLHDRARGLMKLQGKRLDPVRGGDFFKGSSVSAVLPVYNNQYLVSTFHHGIYLLNPAGEVKAWNTGKQAQFRDASINCMIRLKNGNFAAGTQNAGLYILNENGETVLHLTTGQGLENRTVLSLLEDDLQNLWIGNNNGISYVELGSPFTVINEEVGLPGTGYSAFLAGGDLYMGTNTGLYVRDATVLDAPYQLIEGALGQVYHVGQYGNDLLVGHHNGAFRIANRKAQLASANQGSWIFASAPDVNDRLVGGTYGGLQFFDLQNGHWSLISGPEVFRESSRIMEFDRDGYLWVTHGYKGAYKIALDGKRQKVTDVTFYGAEKGFPSNFLINVYSVRNELVFTSERGVYRYDKVADRFVLDPLFTQHFGPDAQLWNIREDELGNVYFIGRNLIGVMRRNTRGSYDVDRHSFNKIRRFLNDDLENLVILKNNEVLFGAKEGFIHYDPRASINRIPTIRTHIRKVTTTGGGDSIMFYGNFVRQGHVLEEQGEDQVIYLPYSRNSVTFSYSATSFESEEEVVHQYNLDRFDKSWSQWMPQSIKEYTNLKEGKYTFRVRSRNVFGEVSRDATYRFVILPPWYRTAWAYTSYTLGIFAVLFTGFMMLDRKYKHQQKAMEVQQEKELSRKDNELEKLAQKTQEEITRLENEKLEAEVRHMNKELGTSTVLILSKNEFISSVKDNLKSLAPKSGNEHVATELAKIVHKIEGNLSSDADWEHFQVYFDKVHGDFSTKFRAAYANLSPQEIRLSAYLRMNLSSKEIAHLLNISIRGVEISRYRLRKKLNIDRSVNLQEFILNF